MGDEHFVAVFAPVAEQPATHLPRPRRERGKPINATAVRIKAWLVSHSRPNIGRAGAVPSIEM